MYRVVNVAWLAAAGLSGVADGAVLRASRLAQHTLRLENQAANVTLKAGLSFVDMAKPPRIARGGEGNSSEDRHDLAAEEVGQPCGITVKANSQSSKHKRCPNDCPLYVQDRTDTDFCTFRCVPGDECAQWNPDTQIPNFDDGVCRPCILDGCAKCDTSVKVDKCLQCQDGYNLKEDGLCYFKYGGAWTYWALGAVGLILLFVVVWLVEWLCRPTCNEMGLEYALKERERCKLKMKKDEDGIRKVFPLTTNLCRTLVAGPGMSAHFTFQAFIICWAIFVGTVWVCFATFIDKDLWVLGTKKFGTPRANCILVAWGTETQQRLMWTKCLFLVIVYTGSILLCILYGIYQLRSFQDVDFQHKTMKDFVAMVCGLPQVAGSKNVEVDLKAAIEEASGVDCIGVSVAWEYLEHEELVITAVRRDTEDAERLFHMNSGYFRGGEPDNINPVSKFFYKMEQNALGLKKDDEVAVDEPSEGSTANDKVGEMLMSLVTSPNAFAVFNTQEDRDRAVLSIEQAGGFTYEGTTGLTLETFEAEPDTVQWQFFGRTTFTDKCMRLVIGFGVILLACLLWGVIFYGPYAFYVMTFNYEGGRQPGFMVGMAFSMIVVVGNAIMYEVCAQISDWVGFNFRDEREACYMVLYCIACVFNVALDFVTTYATAEKIMEGLGFRTYEGVPLQEVTEFTAKFETYGMQRSLAENTFNYAFPSSFLIPFLIEPIPVILLPLFLGTLVVRTHPEVHGQDAADWVAMVPMDMGRYADILLNCILGILIFYFPGGYTWLLFYLMAASHVWIYVFDHYRILRAIPACMYASYDVEFAAQAILAAIIGIIAACLVMKSNCRWYAPHCLKGLPLILACVAAWLVHVILHILVLKFVIPMFGKDPPEEDPAKGATFESLAQKLPCSWFTSNPVHSLRSKHRFQHSPPCSFFILGKEKYMRVNEKIGVYYEESMSEPT